MKLDSRYEVTSPSSNGEVPVYSYSLNEAHVLTVYEDEMSLCTISDVRTDEQAKAMFADVLFEMRGVDIDGK